MTMGTFEIDDLAIDFGPKFHLAFRYTGSGKFDFEIDGLTGLSCTEKEYQRRARFLGCFWGYCASPQWEEIFYWV